MAERLSDAEIRKLIKHQTLARKKKKATTLTKVRSGVEISVDTSSKATPSKLSDLYLSFPETDVNFGKGSNAILSNFADLRPDKRIKVISGGQRGADKIGLEVAKELGFETGGTAPAKFSVSGGKDPSLKNFGLKEITEKQTKAYQGSESFYGPRTERNVLDSDATLIFTVEGRQDSPGSKLTRNLAIKHGKPFLQNPTSEQISRLVSRRNIQTINIAGNREFKDKNIIKSALSSVKGKGLVFGRGGTIKRFRTAEGAYQAFKSGKYVSGFENLSGFDAKKKGRTIPVDKKISESLMRDIVAERFDQDTPFREALLKTGKIKHSVGDKFWSEAFPRILEDVRDFDMKRSSKGEMKRVPRKLRVPPKGPILKDITKQFTALVESTVKQHKDLTQLPVKEKPIKRTQNLDGGPQGFVSQNRKGFITPDVKIQGWLTDMLKQVDDVNKSGGGDLKFFGHSLPANVWGDIVKTSLSGTMQHLDIGKGKGAYKFSLIDPDVKTWVEANRGVEEAILRKERLSITTPFDADKTINEGEYLVKQQDTTLSAHKTRPNLEPVSPSQARTKSGTFGSKSMDAETKKVKVQSTASAVFNVEEAEDFKWSNEGTKVVDELDVVKYSENPIIDHIVDLKKSSSETSLEERYIQTIFTGGSKDKKSEVIQKGKKITTELSPLDDAKESFRATEAEARKKRSKVASKKQSVQQTFLTSTDEVKLKEVDIPTIDRYEKKHQKPVSQFEKDPFVNFEYGPTSKERAIVAKKQVEILKKKGLTPEPLEKKQLPMNFEYGSSGLPGTQKTTFDEIFKGERRSTLRSYSHGLNIGDIVEVVGKQGQKGDVKITGIRDVDASMAEEISKTERWTPDYIEKRLSGGKKTQQIFYEPVVKPPVVKTDTILTASNPANVPIPESEQTVRKRPVATAYDSRSGKFEYDPKSVHELSGESFKEVKKGTEFVPLERKPSVSVLTQEPVIKIRKEGESLRPNQKAYSISGGEVEIPDVFLGSEERIIPEPKPVPLKEGEEIIASGTQVKSGVKQPASVTATTTDVKKWAKGKKLRQAQMNWAMKALIGVTAVPVIDYALAPLDIAIAHETQIKPTQKEFNVGKTGFKKASGFMMPRSRDYEKSMREGIKKSETTALTDFKNWGKDVWAWIDKPPKQPRSHRIR